MTKRAEVVPHSISSIEEIANRIIIIRGERIILDEDLAVLYGLTTGNLNKAVKRNKERFPADFMFQLSNDEFEALKFQTGTSKQTRRGGRRTPPLAYTEHGALMAATVLRSDLAAQMSVYVIRAFVRLRELSRMHPELEEYMHSIDKHYLRYKKHFSQLLDALKPLLDSTHSEDKNAKLSGKPKGRKTHTYTLEFSEANEQAVKFLEAIGATLGEGVVTTEIQESKE
jgi:hypothetical protein